MKKTKDELGENLCDYCHVDKEDRLPRNQFNVGCECMYCDSAYDNYLDEEEKTDEN